MNRTQPPFVTPFPRAAMPADETVAAPAVEFTHAPPDPIRQAHRGTLRLFTVVVVALAVWSNLVLFAGSAFAPIVQASGGWVNGTLLINLLALLVVIGGLLMRWGGLRGYDLGLLPQRLPAALLVTGVVWLVAQAAHAAFGLLADGDLALHPAWMQVGAPVLLGSLLSQLLGTALFEEIAYRGFLLPQAYLRLARYVPAPVLRLALALLLSQVLFALLHIPNRLYLGTPLPLLLPDLAALLLWGCLYAVIYLKTDNLFLAVGVHALANAPTTLFAPAPIFAGGGDSLLVIALGLAAVFGGPLLRTRMRRLRHG
jgi:hypothetical protein